jgi:hypothetical protein
VTDLATGVSKYLHISTILALTQAEIDRAVSKREVLYGDEIAIRIGYPKDLIRRYRTLGDIIRAYRKIASRF